MFGAVAEAAHDDARQAVFALEARQVLLEGDGFQNEPPGLVRDDFPPVCRLGRRQRRLANAEVLGAAGIGGDDQALAMVLDAVFMAVLARRDQPGSAFRPLSVDQIGFIGLVVMGVDDDELARLGLPDADIKAVILLLVDKHVLAGGGTDAMPVDV